MDFWRSLVGMISIELTSADPVGRLRELSSGGLQVFGIQKTGELSVTFQVLRSQFHKLDRIAGKHGDIVRVISRSGSYWKLRKLLDRPVLLGGILIMLFLVWFLPSRVYFFQVEGNNRIPEKLILEAAEQSGIRFGASRSAVRSEKVKNTLLSVVPELQWAGVNTRGCLAIISVQERTEHEITQSIPQVSSIVADRDGVILSCTVTRGNGVCTEGQAVRKGELLISGLTDCGIFITATRAEGEVLAQTQRELTIITPEIEQLRGERLSVSKKYSLIFQKNRINLYNGSGISDSSCVKMYKEYYVTLPGGFRLPICLREETIVRFLYDDQEIAEEEIDGELRAFSERYLTGQMIAGRISDRLEEIELLDGIYCLKGTYRCTEMIGRDQPEQLGEFQSETS